MHNIRNLLISYDFYTLGMIENDKIIMKIPLIENDSWVYDWIVDGKEEYPQTVYIDLNDSRAVEMAIENVKFQAADDYFDALFEVWINDKLFYENHTTDAYMTWRGFLNAMEEKGKHNVVFLDDPIDLIIHILKTTNLFLMNWNTSLMKKIF